MNLWLQGPRNTLVQLFMDNKDYTHLLFIDADISF